MRQTDGAAPSVGVAVVALALGALGIDVAWVGSELQRLDLLIAGLILTLIGVQVLLVAFVMFTSARHESVVHGMTGHSLSHASESEVSLGSTPRMGPRVQ